jgi:nucleoid DNA-binding protein
MSSVNPSPILLLNRRVADRLNDTKVPGGSSLEPGWNPTLVQRVIGATAEAIIEAVSNGEEVQFGKLGRFYPKVVDERIIQSNLKDTPEKVTVPRKLKIEFEPTSYADTKVKNLFQLVETLKTVAQK